MIKHQPTHPLFFSYFQACVTCQDIYNYTKNSPDAYIYTHLLTPTHTDTQNTVHPDIFQPFLSLSRALMFLQLPAITALATGG